MKINIKEAGNITIVEISGDIDSSTASDVQNQIIPLTKTGKNLILDMSQVAYMSSAGLRVLMYLRRQVPTKGAIALVGLSRQIEDTMEVTGFLEVFAVYKTLDEAISSIK